MVTPNGWKSSFITFDDMEDNKMTRKRYLELTRIAKELCEFLEKKGVSQDEGCKMKVLVEELWNLEK